MAISQANVPSITDAVVEIDLASAAFAASVALQGQVTSVQVGGGEHKTSDLSAIDGSTFTQLGGRNPHDLIITAIFTDGETSDVHPLLEAALGNTCWVRYAPKGATTGNRRFTGSGRLYRVDLPSLQENGSILYTVGVRGQWAGEDIPA